MMIVSNYYIYIFLNVFLNLYIKSTTPPSGTTKSCIQSAEKLAAYGKGNTIDSCMNCDPALPNCAPGCQSAIDSLYTTCDAVCLPDGYYYDPLWTIEGCWEPAKPDVKISTERCGCNSTFNTHNNIIFIILIVIVMISWLL